MLTVRISIVYDAVPQLTEVPLNALLVRQEHGGTGDELRVRHRLAME